MRYSFLGPSGLPVSEFAPGTMTFGERRSRGIDDVPAADAAGPTTVRQPIRERGRMLGRMLLDPTCTAERVVLPTDLVIRSAPTRCATRKA